MKTYTIGMIQSEMTDAGSHWWDSDSLYFFRCRVGEKVYQGPGGIYFVTSEKSPWDSRKHSCRQYIPSDKKIATIGEFCSMTRSGAHKLAKKMADASL